MFEVNFDSSIVNSIAVLTDKGNVKRFGRKLGEVKTWNFSSKFQLVGLFGTEIETVGIAKMGIIVFKAEKCPEGVPVEVESNESEN